MSFNWGGFGEGLSIGAQRGLVIGQAIGKMLRDNKYANETEAINKKYDDQISQAKVRHAQISALNGDGDVQAATDSAAGGNVPTAEAGIKEIGAYDADRGSWRPTANDRPATEQTQDYVAEHSWTPVHSHDVRAMSPDRVKEITEVKEDEGLARKPTKESAMPRYSDATEEDEVAALEAQRQTENDRVYRWWVSNDPEKARAFAKEQKENEFNASLKQVYVAALKGDTRAIGMIVGGINANPRAAGLEKGDQIVPVDGSDGAFQLVGADGEAKSPAMTVNRELLAEGFKAFAINKRMEFDGDIDKWLDRNSKLNSERRSEDVLGMQREGLQLQKDQFEHRKEQDELTNDREDKKFAHQVAMDDDKSRQDKLKTNIAFTFKAHEMAAKEGKAGGVGIGDYKFTEDPASTDGTGQLVQTKDGKNIGRVDAKTGVLVPMTTATKEQLALVESAVKQGYKDTTVHDPISGRLEWGWVDPKTGRYSSVAHPNKWFSPAAKQGRLLNANDIIDVTGVGGTGSDRALPSGTPGVPEEGEKAMEAPAAEKKAVTETKPETEKEKALRNTQKLIQRSIEEEMPKEDKWSQYPEVAARQAKAISFQRAKKDVEHAAAKKKAEARINKKRPKPTDVVQPLYESMEKVRESSQDGPRYARKQNLLTKEEREQLTKQKHVDQKYKDWPIARQHGRVLHYQGEPRDRKNRDAGFHSGTTYNVQPWTRVVATHDGKIVAKQEEKGYGPTIIVQSKDGSQQVYSHITTEARVGDEVRAGKYIGNEDNNQGKYGKGNVFFYQHILGKDVKERERALKQYRGSDKYEKDRALGLV